MVYKERTFFGTDPGDAAANQPADLETRVADTLAAMRDIDVSDVTVVSRGNTIVLSGFISSLEEADRAVEAATSVEGVDEVINQMTIPEMQT
ncbi:BON domain-containing protein [Rhizobiaceae bacterium CRRU44]|uniref:BON domain-containing protein n=1 Tax=Ferranicluibacter rubi TaxID=2715133 RepID=A0AA43ZIA5_9HYPH|nr:BON domain-containing protein [Ferranicluibacter rubi]NHT77392.1 BON domain-containing protein [Ferranicluibacter rubi]